MGDGVDREGLQMWSGEDWQEGGCFPSAILIVFLILVRLLIIILLLLLVVIIILVDDVPRIWGRLRRAIDPGWSCSQASERSEHREREIRRRR
jgi:hypothetical protein